mmetsp:Transcript_46559/g.105204  ORF Transcript_46559/g.105204 Transcript_46559/m.105204 type:complete len:295 (-) Transcript_46559:253-1137(-)
MRHGKAYRLIAYTLGDSISEADLDKLRCASPLLLDEVRRFDFAMFPPHVRDLHCYAWKPLLLAELRKEFPREGLVWLDSQVALAGPPSAAGVAGGFPERAVAAAAAQGGVLSDKTSGTVEKWVHEKMFIHFERQLGFRRDFFTSPSPAGMCNGAFSAWAPLAEKQPRAMGAHAATAATATAATAAAATAAAAASKHPKVSLGSHAMDMWEQCAMEKACMCPAGTSRANHRQDQAALTLILATLGIRCYDDRERGPDGKGASWVHARGFRMNRAKCQDLECFVKTYGGDKCGAAR